MALTDGSTNGCAVGQPLIVYVDPIAGGHHIEHLAFYLQVCAAIGVTLRAHVPSRAWSEAVRLVQGRAAGELARDAAVAEPTLAACSAVLEAACEDAARHRAELVFFPMLDDFLFPLALRRALGRRPPAAWSGVFYRDTFNFPADLAGDGRTRLKSHIKKRLLRWVAADGARGLLTLNQDWRAPMPKPVAWLPDALSSLDRMAETDGAHGLPWPLAQVPPGDGRLRLLFFGAITPRKGLVELVEGMLRLEDVDIRRLDLRILGRIPAHLVDYKARSAAALETLARRGAAVERIDEHVPEATLDAALRWSDVVLAPYIRHLGSSGVVGLAVQYGRPLLTQSCYQIGAEVRRWALGLTVDPTDPDAVAAAVRRLLAGEGKVSEGMRTMRDARNSRRAFAVAAETLRAHLGKAA